MTFGRSIIKEMMPIFLGAVILFAVCTGLNAGGIENTFDTKSSNSQIIGDAGQAKQNSDSSTEAESADLTGIWNCDDGGKYYIRQIGKTVAWLGESPEKSATNIAFGEVNGNTVSLRWMDVPKGASSGSGTLILSIESDSMIAVLQETGGFSGTEWTRPETYTMSDLKMTGKRIGRSEINSSPLELHPNFPDLFMSSNPGAPSSEIELVSLNPQPEPPKPPIDLLK